MGMTPRRRVVEGPRSNSPTTRARLNGIITQAQLLGLDSYTHRAAASPDLLQQHDLSFGAVVSTNRDTYAHPVFSRGQTLRTTLA